MFVEAIAPHQVLRNSLSRRVFVAQVVAGLVVCGDLESADACDVTMA